MFFCLATETTLIVVLQVCIRLQTEKIQGHLLLSNLLTINFDDHHILMTVIRSVRPRICPDCAGATSGMTQIQTAGERPPKERL